MNYRMILYLLGWVLNIQGLCFFLPVLVGLFYGEVQWRFYVLMAVLCLVCGVILTLKKPKRNVFYTKEGFVTVALSWLLMSLTGAAPFTISKEIPSYLDAVFEMASGYTTTGGQYYGGTDFSSLFGGRASWMTDEMVREAAGQLSTRALTNATDLAPVIKNGKDVLVLTDEQWSEIKAAEVNVFVPDENNGGWLDLGLDNTAKFTDEGDLIDEWTGNWITLNGNFAAIYPVSDLDEDGNGKYITTKFIPAELNGERVNIIVEFNEETGKDTVLGAEKIYDVDVEHKGLIAIEAGDTIQLLCDHYTEDGSVKDEYKLGNAFTVGSDGLEVYSLKVDNDGCMFTYRLTDLYGAFHWLPLKAH